MKKKYTYRFDTNIIKKISIVCGIIFITLYVFHTNTIIQDVKSINSDPTNNPLHSFKDIPCAYQITKENLTITSKIVYSDLSDGVSKYFGTADRDNWSDVRNRTEGNQHYDTWTEYSKGILAAYNAKTGDVYVISRSYFAFDTSFLDDDTIIHNVSLFIYGMGTAESSVCAVSWNDGPDGVHLDDYGYTGSINFGNTSSWKLETYNEIIFNDQGIGYIEKNGYTYIACREYPHDFLDVAPAGDLLDEHRNGHYFADEPGFDKDPYLLIEYTSTNANGSEPNDTEETSYLSISICLIIVLFVTLIYYRKR